MESYKFEGGEISLIKDNILLVEYSSAKTLTTRNIYNLKKIQEKIMGKRKFYSITDSRNGKIRFSEEAKIFLTEQNKENKYKICDAILVDSFAKKIEVELSIRLQKTQIKTKAFKSLNKALCWFESLEKKELALL